MDFELHQLFTLVVHALLVYHYRFNPRPASGRIGIRFVHCGLMVSQGVSLVLRSYTEAMDRSKGSSVQAVWNRDFHWRFGSSMLFFNVFVICCFVVFAG